MKYLTIVFAFFLFFGGEEQASAQTVQLKLGDYSLTASSAPRKENGVIPFVQGTFVKAIKGAKPFGFSYAQNEGASSDVVLELAHAASKNVIKSISATDFAGKAKTESQNGGARSVSMYQFGTGASMVELQVESELVNDESMPLGKKIHVAYKVRLPKAASLSAVLRLKTEGMLGKLGTVGVASSRLEEDQPTYPAIVLSSLTPVKIDVSPRAGGVQQAAFQSDNISAKEKDWATLFSFEVTGTTVKDAGKATAQAGRIANRI